MVIVKDKTNRGSSATAPTRRGGVDQAVRSGQAPAGWTDADERAFAALEARRDAWQAERDEVDREVEERKQRAADLFARLKSTERSQPEKVGDVVRYVDDSIDAVREELSVMRDEMREEFVRVNAPLIEKIDGIAEDINKLTDRRRELDSGGIGYDHEAEKADEGRSGKRRAFKFGRLIGGMVCNWTGEAEKYPEREILAEQYKALGLTSHVKTLQFGVGSGGGILIPPQMLADWVELLRPLLALRAAGARFLPLDGPAQIPKWGSGSSSHWAAEGRRLTMSEPTFGMINLTPHPLVTAVPISEDMLDMGPASFQSQVEEDMALSEAETLDLSGIKGDGSEGEPSGVKDYAGGTTDFVGAKYGDPTGSEFQNISDLLDDMIYGPGARNVRGNGAFITSPRGIQKLRTVKDNDGHPLLFETRGAPAPQASNDGPETGTLWGRPFVATTQLDYGTAMDDLYYAVWRHLVIARFGMSSLRVSYDAYDPTTEQSAFSEAKVFIRLRSKWDVALRQPAAVQRAVNWDNAP